MNNEFEKGWIYEFSGAEGQKIRRKITQVTEKYIYYSVQREEGGDWENSFVLSHAHFRDFIRKYQGENTDGKI